MKGFGTRQRSERTHQVKNILVYTGVLLNTHMNLFSFVILELLRDNLIWFAQYSDFRNHLYKPREINKPMN